MQKQYKLGKLASERLLFILAASCFASSFSYWILLLGLIKGYIPFSMVAISKSALKIDILTFWGLVKINEKVFREEKNILEKVVRMTGKMSDLSKERLEVDRNMVDVS